MVHKRRVWQVSDWNLSIEALAAIARESGWNYCLCQAFHLQINGREIYLLNDSFTPDAVHFFQEYGAVVVTEREELEDGRWRCRGIQIESLTVNGHTPLVELLSTLGDPAHDCGTSQFTFILERGDVHICTECR